jgi:hypothetical protein
MSKSATGAGRSGSGARAAAVRAGAAAQRAEARAFTRAEAGVHAHRSPREMGGVPAGRSRGLVEGYACAAAFPTTMGPDAEEACEMGKRAVGAQEAPGDGGGKAAARPGVAPRVVARPGRGAAMLPLARPELLMLAGQPGLPTFPGGSAGGCPAFRIATERSVSGAARAGGCVRCEAVRSGAVRPASAGYRPWLSWRGGLVEPPRRGKPVLPRSCMAPRGLYGRGRVFRPGSLHPRTSGCGSRWAGSAGGRRPAFLACFSRGGPIPFPSPAGTPLVMRTGVSRWVQGAPCGSRPLPSPARSVVMIRIA